jgi:hypothetical protein
MGNVAIFKGKLVKFLAKAGILIPKRATTDRSLTPEQGETAFNTTDNKLEIYNGSSWVQLDAGGGTTGTLIHPSPNSTFEFGAQDNIAAGQTYTGWGNTAIGVDAGDSLSSGEFNTLYGYDAGGALSKGFRNTFVGYGSGKSGTGDIVFGSTFNQNTAMGMYALQTLTTGVDNVAIGYSAGSGTLTSGSYNTIINSSANLTSGLSGIVIIGKNSSGGNSTATQTNDFVLGTSAHNYKFPGTIISFPLKLGSQNEIRFYDAFNSNYVAFKSQTTVTSVEVYELPTVTGTVGQVLGISSIPTTGTTRLAWTTPASGTVSGSNISGPIYSRSSGQATKIYSKSASNALANRAVNTWTNQTSAADTSWSSVCWSADLNLFCAVAFLSAGNRVMTSPDGITWTGRTAANQNSWRSVCWSPELKLFCAVNDDLSGTGATTQIMTSSDSITWTVQTAPANTYWQSVCWIPELGLFCSVADGGIGNLVMTSPDGVIWTGRTASEASNWISVCWSSELNLLCAIAYGGTNRVMTSPDGITWTSRSAATANTWQSVCWSPELSLFCAVSTTGIGNRVMTSPDGITWTSRTSAADQSWTSVCWSPELGLFSAVSSDGTNRIMTSPDGINWTLRASTSTNFWRSICWSSEKGIFCSVSSTGIGTRVKTSKYVGVRGITSY